jgi:hypothetical protein
MATRKINSVGSTDPRVAAILREIASLAHTASETMESAELSAEAAAGLQLMRQIGYLADSGIKITGGIQQCGGAADWFAPFLNEGEVEVAHA